ncbi:helix-turn-helix domain-containing protein [Flavobacterium sp. XGLA_31]|uniref:helix-turn-helix domain-containing protein n=1 Tax=Flavobacterium sp. XGLA_31 TaxID=3447666 RepID=UPI003F34DA33
MKNNPVYNIQHFSTPIQQSNLYVNTFKNHLKAHPFIEKPHRHNFYLLVLFTAGSGMHEIDFERFTIKPGSLFVLQPGQMHHWELSNDIEGYILFYTRESYNLHFGNRKIEDYPFYQSMRNTPEIIFSEEKLSAILPYFELLLQQNNTAVFLNLLDCIHIKTTQLYLTENNHTTHSYNYKIRAFEILLEEFYKTQKSPSFYAENMNITLKHLNRICKETINQTVTESITNRVVLEAKRLLINPNYTVNQIADTLGFENYSYFTRLFKQKTGITPREFRMTQTIGH